MTCCVPADNVLDDPAGIEADDAALLRLSRRLGDDRHQLDFAVPDAHCAACIRTIETSLGGLPFVASARVNLSKRRVRVTFNPSTGAPSAIGRTIRASGYHTHVIDFDADDARDPAFTELLRATGIAGFAAANIMLFSVSVWSGASDTTRDLFHWFSALIALPAIAFAGLPFFRSAWRAVRVGKTNMDVPISIGVLLATGLSIYETAISGPHAYFDAATMLLFFLLVGRTLDHLMRERARSAITNLSRLAPSGATRVHADGNREFVALDDIAPGMILEIRAGDRVPVDAAIADGSASFDFAAITGEPTPRTCASGSEVPAGAINLSGPIQLRVLRAAPDSFLARMIELMEAAEGARTRRRRIADRAAAIYAPAVHSIAVLTFLGWGVASGDWHAAILNAVAVLIITCPCALALAVPIVHVVAAGRLFERGILMRDGAALERAAEIDRVAFDKTGTLTRGTPVLRDQWAQEDVLDTARALAASSTHPLSRALVTALGGPQAPAPGAIETPGRGVEARLSGVVWRLGSPSWCNVPNADDGWDTQVWLSRDGVPSARFSFRDLPRQGARAAVAALARLKLPVQMLSGDNPTAAAEIGAQVGITDIAAGLLPADKVVALSQGRALMVGDGINDAPALRAAHVSMAPATATDVGRSAADFVYRADSLDAVPFMIDTARRAQAIVTQNLVLAIGYNAIAVPLAISGMVTPLIAAVAMSASSILVVANAMRLRWGGLAPEERPNEVSDRGRPAPARAAS